MTLDQLALDTPARIAAIDWSLLAADEAKRLQALGIDTGAEIWIVHRGIFLGRDPIAVQIGAMIVALRRSHARALGVEPL